MVSLLVQDAYNTIRSHGGHLYYGVVWDGPHGPRGGPGGTHPKQVHTCLWYLVAAHNGLVDLRVPHVLMSTSGVTSHWWRVGSTLLVHLFGTSVLSYASTWSYGPLCSPGPDMYMHAWEYSSSLHYHFRGHGTGVVTPPSMVMLRMSDLSMVWMS